MKTDLQHIRSLAEMILQKVDTLEQSTSDVSTEYQQDINKPRFKVGDIVDRVYQDGHKISIGKIREVIEYSGFYRYVIEQEKDRQWLTYDESQIALTLPKFKVGDQVGFYWLSESGKCDTYTEAIINRVEHKWNEWYYWFDRPKPYINTPAGGFAEHELTLVKDKLKEDRVWHSGPPPHVGWWNAVYFSHKDNPDSINVWRWWNGKEWSVAALSHHDVHGARNSALTKLGRKYTDQIVWTNYWPANARVPRINPDNNLIT